MYYDHVCLCYFSSKKYYVPLNTKYAFILFGTYPYVCLNFIVRGSIFININRTCTGTNNMFLRKRKNISEVTEKY